MRNVAKRVLFLTVLLSWSTITAGVAASAERDELLIADFEGKTYGDWKTTGEAFGPGPAGGTLRGQMDVSGFRGRGLVNSFFQGDGSTGTLTSPPFVIRRKHLNFLLGGGMHPNETCINLLIGGKVVRTATGPNDRPGGSERLDWHSWDVEELAGKEATIQIVDRGTGGWGHVNVDHIVLSDKKQQTAGPAQRELLVEHRYLHLPVKNGAPKRRMKYVVEGATDREFEIELADAEPDFWVFSDVSRLNGCKVTLVVNRLPSGSHGLTSIVQSDEIPNADQLYKEKHRPQFHFSSRRGWNNDPNGLVYHKGEYHLFYQHNPYGWRWGNMHWGHAVSKDLVHWKELPVAIYPHQFGDWVFSGSAVMDKANTAGFKTRDEDVLVAAYTSTGRGEAIAYSNDRGRTFTDYQGNPVVKHRGRDPKVIWYGPGKHWVMAVYDERDDSRGIAFYTSSNLKQWEYQSRIDTYYECPEIFELPVDGDKNDTRWVVYGADGAYAIGRFDGKKFTTTSGKHRFKYGNCFYASQTFSDVPAEDGRRIQIAWGQIGHPEMPFNQMMNFPVVLTLRTTSEGIRMFANPVSEIANIHGKRTVLRNKQVGEDENLLEGVTGELFHIRCEARSDGAREFGLRIRGVPVTYDFQGKTVTCADKTAAVEPVDGKIRLEILVDRTSIEIFAGDGRIYMPIGVILPVEDQTLEVFSTGGKTTLDSLEVYELHSAW